MKSSIFPISLAIITLFSCTKLSDNSKIIARIGSISIRENQFNQVYEARKNVIQKDLSEKAKKIAFLKLLLETKAQYMAAEEAGLTNDPVLKRRYESVSKRIIHQRYREWFISENGGVQEKTLINYFDKHMDQFKTDSNVPTFIQAKPKVVDKYLLEAAKLDSFYQANKPRYIKVTGQDTLLPPLAENLDRIQKDYLQNYKEGLNRNLKETLYSKYNVITYKPETIISEENLQSFYQSHKENYRYKDTYEISHLELDSKEGLVDILKGTKNLEDFKARAANSQNSWTKASNGYIGYIKKTHCLPFGIGTLPALFPILDSMSTLSGGFKITLPIVSPQTQKWHVFVLHDKKLGQLKPLDMIKTIVKQDYIKANGESISPEQVLATYNGKGKITEEDVLFLRTEIPPQFQKRYTREDLIGFLVLWDLVYLEANELGLLKDPAIQVILQIEKDGYWSQAYKDSIEHDNFGFDSSVLAKAFNKNKALFVKEPANADYSNNYARDVAAFLTMNPLELEIEYHSFPHNYVKDSMQIPFEQAKYQIFQNIKSEYLTLAKNRINENLTKKYNAVILDSAYQEMSESDPIKAYALAQNLHADRKLNEALNQYKHIRKSFPQAHSLQDSVSLGMAQVYIEFEKFQEALGEYRRLLYLYPKSPNNYKAQFMIGFIYSENLKDDKKAIEAFKSVLENFPNCDLADDADWMIRNIESGGALMPVFEES